MAVVAATMGASALVAVAPSASAQGYYGPGSGFYGKPYVYVPPVYVPPVYRPPVYRAPVVVVKPKCFWETYRYRGPYGGWLTGRRWVCR